MPMGSPLRLILSLLLAVIFLAASPSQAESLDPTLNVSNTKANAWTSHMAVSDGNVLVACRFTDGPPEDAETLYYHAGAAYVCENAAGATRSCDFRSGKVILQQPVERLQMVKLLATGKTDLLPRFISKKGRPFKAYLVKGPHGRVSFEFEPRKGKATAAQKPTVPGTAVKLLREPAGKAVKKAAKPAAKPATRKRKQA